ncbi:antitoxin of the YafO-YafN toxin-antitoxin system [Canicola haemoglobinophilus]|uniref:Antitoxin of the YafO-YafN toxin-antitoxin system n=1 Tax=Canicola haemoglobinophilus TaxID=733 RepID=A0AB38H7M4_9PAST|nr:stability protein StbD [Canicola haemoglobinophilus]MBN6710119.1 stability protein StbD [Canicola haemoglobinophilus]STO54638.1 antitoxin of the YafO-YafN toxin-antitoxin system [Canicola haemoglobinophilus]STO67587.1 antitoxin of the YafO-YafN toxin-antitoxin system [Canicola haemoglobinophilus]
MAIHQILTTHAASITDLKRNPMQIVKEGTENSGAIAILNRNEPAFYCVTPAFFEYLQELAEDLELGKIAQQRLAEKDIVAVSLDDL